MYPDGLTHVDSYNIYINQVLCIDKLCSFINIGFKDHGKDLLVVMALLSISANECVLS